LLILWVWLSLMLLIAFFPRRTLALLSRGRTRTMVSPKLVICLRVVAVAGVLIALRYIGKFW
jgi:hypothetical protein